MKSVITVAALAALAGAANADVLQSWAPVYDVKTETSASTLDLTPSTPRAGQTFDVDLTGIQSWDSLGSATNTVLLIDVAAALGAASGTQVTMNGIGWDVTLSTNGASWASEAVMYFDDNIAPDLSGLFLTPFFDQSTPGTFATSSGGILKLADAGIPDIVLADGILRIEFYESFDDVAGAADANWGGTITIQAVPAPGGLALLGLGGLAAARRRR